MLTPRPPSWALRGGLPTPQEGEDFAAYWHRLGFQENEIAAAVDGLHGARLDVANERMAHLLRERMPVAFQRAVYGLAVRGGVRPTVRL